MGACEGVERGLLYLPYPVQHDESKMRMRQARKTRAAACESKVGVEWR